jgi:cullin 3
LAKDIKDAASTFSLMLKHFHLMAMKKAEIVNDKGELSWKGVRSAIYYKQRFEDVYIAYAIGYYESKAGKWINTMSCPEYTKTVLESFKREEELIERLLLEESRKKLIKQLTDKLINAHVNQLIDMDKTGVKEMLANKRNEELKMLTVLLTRSPRTFTLIVERFHPYLISRGKALKENKELIEDPVAYIKAFVDLRVEIEELITYSFASMDSFNRSNDLAFQEILEDFDLIPKYLAYYIDSLMRIELKGKETEMETLVDRVFTLFKLLKSKDAFAEHHKVCILGDM